VAYYNGSAAAALPMLREAASETPNCPLVHAWLSHVLLRLGKRAEAFSEGDRAKALLGNGDDREQRIVYAWSQHLKAARTRGVEAAKARDEERTALNFGIVLYPDDVDLWTLRGDAAEDPVSAAPFRLYTFHLDPQHPLHKLWKRPVTKVPVLPPPQNDMEVSKPTETPKLFEGLGAFSFPITTSNPLAQKYFEQGMRCFDAYVTPSGVPNSAARCFQYAMVLDPQCAMARWGLTFCLNENDKLPPNGALILARTALALARAHGTDREQRFCACRVLELSGSDHRDEFLEALDGAIAAYPNDMEFWIWRGKVYGDYGTGDDEPQGERVLAGMPFELAAYGMHPEHPSPNHELIHDYEAIGRPALGWKYTVGFRQSAPNMPHANHMQAHLAMRLGRWGDALEATEAAWRKSKEGFPELSPQHHLEVYCLVLLHEGKFDEFQKVASTSKEDATNVFWERMLRLKADESGLIAWARQHLNPPTAETLYVSALANLDQGNLAEAARLDGLLGQLAEQKKLSTYDYLEVHARCLIASGKVDEGMNLFQNTAAQAVSDQNLHLFGGGGYFPEVWGEAALRLGRLDAAELAFSEALAHDHGSIVGALGTQVVWERRGNAEMAKQYAALAADIWKRADVGALERQLARLRKMVPVK
jgi:tetratricopeptide (TPR) repeat protein